MTAFPKRRSRQNTDELRNISMCMESCQSDERRPRGNSAERNKSPAFSWWGFYYFSLGEAPSSTFSVNASGQQPLTSGRACLFSFYQETWCEEVKKKPLVVLGLHILSGAAPASRVDTEGG